MTLTPAAIFHLGTWYWLVFRPVKTDGQLVQPRVQMSICSIGSRMQDFFSEALRRSSLGESQAAGRLFPGSIEFSHQRDPSWFNFPLWNNNLPPRKFG